MKRIIASGGRVYIGDALRGTALSGKITLSGTVRGILISPYQKGDEKRVEECKVTEADAVQRINLSIALCRKAHLAVGDEVDLLFREDGSILVVPARDVCSLCGKQSDNMIRLENGRLVCENCRKKLCHRGKEKK